MERQVGDPGQAPVHLDHRRFALGLGWLVETSRASSAQERSGESFSAKGESCNRSNWRQLTAIALSPKSSASMMRKKVVMVEIDNILTNAYINHMGEPKVMLSAIA